MGLRPGWRKRRSRTGINGSISAHRSSSISNLDGTSMTPDRRRHRRRIRGQGAITLFVKDLLKKRVDRWGLEALNVRERRRPRMPNQIGPHLEGRIIAFALAHPGFGPRRISAELAREKWGGIRISEHGVWRVLRRVGLNTRAKRLALIARHRDPYERKPDLPPPERHIDATAPGEKVQLDCFYVGRLSGTKGTVWQYTAIDVASAFCWAELHATERNPRSRRTSQLLHRVAAELAAAG